MYGPEPSLAAVRQALSPGRDHGPVIPGNHEVESWLRCITGILHRISWKHKRTSV